MSADGRKKRFRAVRKSKYKSLKKAASDMQNAGYKISYQQLHRIENGKWPSEYQITSFAAFFQVRQEWLLYGIDGVILDDLHPEDRRAARRLLRRLPRLNPPPHQ